MRVQFLINRYPPFHLGGYELRFLDLARGLRARGHEVAVVTSDVGSDSGHVDDEPVSRVLGLVPEVHGLRGILRFIARSRRDVRTLRTRVARFAPDVVVVGNFYGLSSALWTVLAVSGRPLILDVSNTWLVDLATTHGNWFRIWEKPSRSPLRRIPKTTLRAILDHLPGGGPGTRFPELSPELILTTASHLRDRLSLIEALRHIPIAVEPSGIDLDVFPFRGPPGEPTRLLFVGRIKALKGVTTLVRALSLMPPVYRLTVVGIPDDPDYHRQVLDLVAGLHLRERISFREPVERADLARLFAQHGVLVFPSEGEEAFSRLVLEAMACGIPVVATPAGGTKEAIRHGVNGILFATGDAEALARAVMDLAEAPRRRDSIIQEARGYVRSTYDLRDYIRRIERRLEAVISQDRPSRTAAARRSGSEVT